MEESIIEVWFQQYEKDITSFLVYYTGSMDVEDLVQDTFLIALSKLSKFKRRSHPKTWLISIARNIVIDRYRRKKVWEKIKHYFTFEQKTGSESEEWVIKNQEHQLLYEAIDQLNPQYREVVILKGILELPSRETGEILKCTSNHVNVTYHRALKKLRTILDEEGIDHEGNRKNHRRTKEPS